MKRARPGAAASALGLASSAVVCALLALACGRSEERYSELRLREAIDHLRRASGPDRRVQLAVVRDLPARTPAGSAARDACTRAYTELADAEDAIFQAEVHMKHSEGVGAPPAAAAAEVAVAEALLAKAKADMPACEAAAAELARVAR